MNAGEASPALGNAAVRVGDLVVCPGEAALGVGRVERLLVVAGVAAVRVLLYEKLGFVVRPLAAVTPCPAGVWPPAT